MDKKSSPSRLDHRDAMKIALESGSTVATVRKLFNGCEASMKPVVVTRIRKAAETLGYTVPAPAEVQQ